MADPTLPPLLWWSRTLAQTRRHDDELAPGLITETGRLHFAGTDEGWKALDELPADARRLVVDHPIPVGILVCATRYALDHRLTAAADEVSSAVIAHAASLPADTRSVLLLDIEASLEDHTEGPEARRWRQAADALRAAADGGERT